MGAVGAQTVIYRTYTHGHTQTYIRTEVMTKQSVEVATGQKTEEEDTCIQKTHQ